MLIRPKSLAWQVQVQQGKEGSPWAWNLPSLCSSPGAVKTKMKTEGEEAVSGRDCYPRTVQGRESVERLLLPQDCSSP